MMRNLNLALIGVLAATSVSLGAEPFDVEAFCTSLRSGGPTIELQPQRVYQTDPAMRITALALSADMTRFATTDNRGGLAVWDTKTGKLVSRLRTKLPDNDAFSCVALSHGGRVVIAGSSRHGCYVVHANDGRAARPVATDAGRIVQVAFNKDSRYIVVATQDGKCLRCRLDGSEEERCETPRPATAEIQRVAIPSDAEHVSYYVGRTGPVQVYRFSAGADKPATELRAEMPIKDYVYQLVSTSKVTFLSTGRNGMLSVKLPRFSGDRYVVQSLPMFVAGASWTSLTPDERWMMLAARSGWIEIRPTFAPTFPLAIRVPVEHAHCMTMGSDGRTILCADQQGAVHSLRLSSPAESPNYRAASTLRMLLESEQYDQIEQVFAHFERETTPLPWQIDNPPLATLVDMLFSDHGDFKEDLELDTHLTQWSQRRPDARLPKLLHAKRLIVQGWRARGTGVASTVTEEGWKVFHAHLAEARALVDPIVEEQKPLPLAYELIGILGYAQGVSNEQMKPYEDRLMEEAPHYLPAHNAFMQRRMPRWGGAPEDCHNYASQVADAIGGEAGDGMYTRLCWAQRHSYTPQAFLEMAGLNRERFERGLLYLSRQTTTDSKWAAHKGLRYAYDIRDAEVAKPFGERLLSAGWDQSWQAGWWLSDEELRSALKFADGSLKLPPYKK